MNFNSVPKEEISFKIKNDTISFYGVLKKKDALTAILNGTIEGSLALECDMCSKPYERVVEEPITLSIVYGTHANLNHGLEDLDVVETEDGLIDLETILNSEVEAMKTDYNYCPQCDIEEPLSI